MEPASLYNQDLWPGVTCFIISEMVKRSWTMFKLYLSNISLEIGRSSNYDDIEIDLPTLFDDEVHCYD